MSTEQQTQVTPPWFAKVDEFSADVTVHIDGQPVAVRLREPTQADAWTMAGALKKVDCTPAESDCAYLRAYICGPAGVFPGKHDGLQAWEAALGKLQTRDTGRLVRGIKLLSEAISAEDSSGN